MKMKSTRQLWVAVVVTVAGGHDLRGQTGGGAAPAFDSVFPIGERVRISAPAIVPYRVTGALVELFQTDSGPSLVVRVSDTDELRELPIGAIETLERFTGRKRNALKGAIWGAGFNLVFSLPVQLGCDDSYSFYKYCYDGVGDWALSIGFGAAFGALIGFFVKSDRWTEVPIDRRPPQVSLGAMAPGPVGVPGLGVSLTW